MIGDGQNACLQIQRCRRFHVLVQGAGVHQSMAESRKLIAGRFFFTPRPRRA